MRKTFQYFNDFFFKFKNKKIQITLSIAQRNNI